MDLPQPLIPGHLIRRYQRFLADVRLADGGTVTAHSPNTGALLGCQDPGSPVWLWRSDNPKRKYPLTWELVRVAGGALVGINTARSNPLVREAIENRVLAELSGYHALRSEVRYGIENSRIDLLLERHGARCYCEVKNVTAAVDRGVALFPDAVSARGSKHLRELMAMVREGHRAVIVFCVQREDAKELRPADAIDPEYGQTLRAAMAAGVEALAYRAQVTLARIALNQRVPVVCP
jgi:sugar fermentation stimulation protein A